MTPDDKNKVCKAVFDAGAIAVRILDAWTKAHPNAPRSKAMAIEFDLDGHVLEFKDEWAGMSSEILEETALGEFDAMSVVSNRVVGLLPETALPLKCVFAVEAFRSEKGLTHAIDLVSTSLGGVKVETSASGAVELLHRLERRLDMLAIVEKETVADPAGRRTWMVLSRPRVDRPTLFDRDPLQVVEVVASSRFEASMKAVLILRGPLALRNLLDDRIDTLSVDVTILDAEGGELTLDTTRPERPATAVQRPTI